MKLFPEEVPKEAEKEVTAEERVEAEKQLHKGKKAIKDQYHKIKDEIEEKLEAQHRHHRSGSSRVAGQTDEVPGVCR